MTRSMISSKAIIMLWIPVSLITCAHYLTGSDLHFLHDIFRRLYYIPIILSAFMFSLVGSATTALVVSILYVPHAFTTFANIDPAHGIEKLLEIVLYNAVGGVTGLLVNRKNRETERAEKLVISLEKTLREKEMMENELVRAGRLCALGELTSGLAHEIRNPLASLKCTAQIIGDEIPETSPRKRMLELHIKEIDRLSRILDRFLEFAKPQQIQNVEFDVKDMVSDVVSLVRHKAEQQKIDIRFEVSAVDTVIHGDKDKLSQVVLNLLLNALQSMPDGGDIVIEVDQERIVSQQFLQIKINDSGHGIPEEIRDRIFDPFFTTRPEGTGLGLSISARIVEAHGGMIRVSDSKPQGTCFSILIPYRKS